MGNRRARRLATPLLFGLVPALVIVGYLFLRDTTPPAPAPTPPRLATLPALAAPALPPTQLLAPTIVPTDTPASAPFVALSPSPAAPTGTSAALPPTPVPPTATPTEPVWVEVGRWRDSQLMVTAPFTVRGPWRVRWRLDAATEPFQVMIEEGALTPVLLTSPPGTTAGVIDQPRGGTYSLMLHNSIPYEVIVEELRAP